MTIKLFLTSARNWLFGSTSISVGHCWTRRGAGVLLVIGRKRCGLTPDGARKIAEQLQSWADHADNQDSTIQTMKWIISVKSSALETPITKWVATSLDATAEKLATGEASAEIGDRSHSDASSVVR